MNTFDLTPIEAANAKRLDLRDTHTVEIKWLYFPCKGRAYRHYLKQKAHIETQITWLAVLDTNELFHITTKIKEGKVPSFFEKIIETIYNLKKQGNHVVSISIGDNVNTMPLFEYNDDSKWKNPGIPNNKQVKAGPVEVLLPRKPKVPTQPIQQLPPEVVKLLQKARKKG